MSRNHVEKWVSLRKTEVPVGVVEKPPLARLKAHSFDTVILVEQTNCVGTSA